MVIDNLKNAPHYRCLGPGIAAALRFIAGADAAQLELGRHDIRGDEVYALVQEYETKLQDTAVWEAHRKYIDVQYIASGVERMGYANLDTMKGMEITSEYDPAKDVVKFRGQGDFFLAEAGTFAIFWPQDAHMPSIAVSQPAKVRKVVVKVRVQER